MNLFSSNFNSVKAVINKAVINEKTSKNSYKKLISNIKQKETKNIIKLAGIGVSLISTIYFVIKRYNKYTKENIQQENEAQIKKLQQENEAQIKKLQQENEAQIKEIQQENEAKLKEIQQENEARIKKLQQENEAQIKKIQEKDNTRRKKEVQLKKNSKQWFETFETQYKEMVISFRENLNSDEKIKIFVNFCLEAIELERQYLEIFSMGLNLENYSYLSGKVIVINTGVILNFNHDNSDPLIDCDDDHKTAEKVLDDLKETFSAVSIISSFLGIFNSRYLFEICNDFDTNYFIGSCIFWRPVTGFKIINDEFVEYYNYYLHRCHLGVSGNTMQAGLYVKQHEEFKNIFLLACEKENILKYLNILEENLRNPFIVQKESILELFTFY